MKDYTIIAFALDSFGGPWLSRQFIATHLSQQAKVLYSTPERQFDTLLKNIKSNNKSEPFFAQKALITENLVHLTPGGVFPRFYDTRTALNALSHHLRMERINRTVRSMNWPAEKVIYSWDPAFHEVFGSLDESVSIFHCIDYFPHYFPEGSSDRKRSIRHLESCLKKADIVFTTCKILEDKLAEHVDRKYTRLLHGVNLPAFNHKRAGITPHELKDIPHPRLAHIGRINNKIDVQLMAEIAERNPQWSVVLMGPIVSGLSTETQAGLDRLEKLPNAYLIPGKPPEELPAFYNAIDVGLMAYHMDFWVPYGLPLKYFEFQGGGKPMVCSPLDSMKEFPKYVTIADSVESWIAAIKDALSSDSQEKHDDRKTVSALGSWDHRALEIFEHIEEVRNSTQGRVSGAS